MQCDNIIEARRPDIVLVEKNEKTCMIVDTAVPGEGTVHEKEVETIEKYQELRREIIMAIEKGTSCSCCDGCPWKCDYRL